MKQHWIFIAYKDKKYYPLKPFHKKIFDDFIKMKKHSAKHSHANKHKHCYPKYLSTYIKTTDL